MSNIKQASVIFTVPYAQQENFFSCLPFIVSDLQYLISEMKDLKCELKVMFVFKPSFDDRRVSRSMDYFLYQCQRKNVCLSFDD